MAEHLRARDVLQGQAGASHTCVWRAWPSQPLAVSFEPQVKPAPRRSSQPVAGNLELPRRSQPLRSRHAPPCITGSPAAHSPSRDSDTGQSRLPRRPGPEISRAGCRNRCGSRFRRGGRARGRDPRRRRQRLAALLRHIGKRFIFTTKHRQPPPASPAHKLALVPKVIGNSESSPVMSI